MRMKVYIASSWKNQHGVEMLTAELHRNGMHVISWVQNNYLQGYGERAKHMGVDKWLNSFEAKKAFDFDTHGATNCDLFIYYGPAGNDACAEMGAAWARNIPILGLYAKGTDLGLMRYMVKQWCYRYTDLITAAIKHKKTFEQ